MRSHLNKILQEKNNSVQSFLDKKRSHRSQGTKDQNSSFHVVDSPAPLCPIQGNEVPMLLNSLLSTDILATPNPTKIKIPAITPFFGTQCPEEHMIAYKNLMVLYTTDPALLWNFFSITLTGLALTWYTSLPNGSINSFVELETKFLGDFMASKRQEKFNFHLLSINKQERETLSAYLQRFHGGVLAVTNLEESIVVSALINGMKTHMLKFQLLEN